MSENEDVSESKEEQQAGPSEVVARLSSERHKQPLSRQQHIERWLELVTAIMLGVVTVATARSSYQATRWSGVQSASYTEAGALRVESTHDTTLTGQLVVYDASLFGQWLNAYAHSETRLAGMYERRFRPEFRPAFEAWLASNPFNNPHAPPGPFDLPQYKISLAEKADQLESQAVKTFDEGQAANEQGDDYVFNTVILAMVLFLTAIANRFEWNRVRIMILLFALVWLLFGLYHLVTYPIT